MLLKILTVIRSIHSRWAWISCICQQPITCLRRRWSLYSWSKGRRDRVMATTRRRSKSPRPWWSTFTASRVRSGPLPRHTKSHKSCHQVRCPPQRKHLDLSWDTFLNCSCCPPQAMRRRSPSGSVWLSGRRGWGIPTLKSVFETLICITFFFSLHVLVCVQCSFTLWPCAGGCPGQRGDLPVQAEASVPTLCHREHLDIQPAEQPWTPEAHRAASAAHRGSVRAQQCRTALQRHRRSDISRWVLTPTRPKVKLLLCQWCHNEKSKIMDTAFARFNADKVQALPLYICSWADIHAVVKEIVSINNVDILKIRNMMLEKWICKTGPAVTKVCQLDSVCISTVL